MYRSLFARTPTLFDLNALDALLTQPAQLDTGHWTRAFAGYNNTNLRSPKNAVLSFFTSPLTLNRTLFGSTFNSNFGKLVDVKWRKDNSRYDFWYGKSLL